MYSRKSSWRKLYLDPNIKYPNCPGGGRKGEKDGSDHRKDTCKCPGLKEYDQSDSPKAGLLLMPPGHSSKTIVIPIILVSSFCLPHLC